MTQNSPDRSPASPEAPRSELQELAELHGIQTAYEDVTEKRHEATERALLLMLRALGAPVESPADAKSALQEWQSALTRRWLGPVSVLWDGKPGPIALRLPEEGLKTGLTAHLTLEAGEPLTWTIHPERLTTVETSAFGGKSYVVKALSLPEGLPWGYHRLRLETAVGAQETLIISAPTRAYDDPGRGKMWGVFIPLYALHSKRSWGAGDFSDMAALYGWLNEQGGQVVATLPFLAAFLEEPFEPSPYSPASRLFWNEFYLDLRHLAEFQGCPEAQQAFQSIEAGEAQALRSSPLVDYHRQMALKRRILMMLADCAFSKPLGKGDPSFQKFLKSHPQAEDYAQFRAVGERLRKPWREWPQPLRDGVVKPGDYDEKIKDYHLYVQWKAYEQILELSARAREVGPGLYLDLPLGVHADSYDTWRERELYPLDVAGGAPPDIVFTKGQNWGFPPLHPEKIREDGYRYVIRYLRHVMQQAGILRIDHVMGLHRLFCVPKELEATEGVYVSYPAEELYAILSLESHRNECIIVGENLGTCPEYINEAMHRHNIYQMYVVQYELEGKHPDVLRPIPADSVASLNTHDMYPFAAFWKGMDIDDRKEVGLLKPTDVPKEQENRETVRQNVQKLLERQAYLDGSATGETVLQGTLDHLGASPSAMVLVTMEDLWQETNPQNVPGIQGQRPNWRRKARYTLEDLQRMPEVNETLKAVDQSRRKPAQPEGKDS